MFFDLATAVNNDLVDIPSRELGSEMRRYDKEYLRTARFDENITQHYDLLTAAAIGFQMKDERVQNNKVIQRKPIKPLY